MKTIFSPGMRGLLGMAVLSISTVLFASGCNQKVIDHVAFQVSPDAKQLSVALVFANNIQSNIAGSFPIQNYGSIFVQQYSATQPFELGFNLDTSIVNDQNYVHLTPTTFLPNGVPLGLSYPLVQIQAAQPISKQFDLSGYIDVANQTWFGGAVSFNFFNDTNFPPGMAISGAFAQNSAGAPGILAYVYGATVNTDGTMRTPGGIAVLANVKQLAGIAAQRGGGVIELKPISEDQVRIYGEHAGEWSQAPSAAWLELQEKFIRLMNEHSAEKSSAEKSTRDLLKQ